MAEIVQERSTDEHRGITAPEVAAILDHHQDEIAQAWAELGAWTLDPSNGTTLPVRKARILLLLKEMAEALLSGRYDGIEHFASESTASLVSLRLGIGDFLLLWTGLLKIALPVFRRVYPSSAERVLACMGHLSDCVNRCIAIYSQRYAAEMNRLALMDERERIALELHDTVAQMAFGIGLHAHQAMEDRSLPETARAHLGAITHLAARSGSELRSAIFVLKHLGTQEESELPGLLQSYVDDFQSRTGIRAILTLPGEMPALPPKICTSIYRMVRESLSNVRKHSHASVVLVSVRCEDHCVTVSIQDNGSGLPKGFDIENADNDLHFGLSDMRRMAEELQGEFTVSPNDDGGTRVQVRLPLAQVRTQ